MGKRRCCTQQIAIDKQGVQIATLEKRVSSLESEPQDSRRLVQRQEEQFGADLNQDWRLV
jgi:hypothetical protein